MATNKVTITGQDLTIKNIVHVAKEFAPAELADKARKRVAESNKWVSEIVSSSDAVYGINTGFGIFADKNISPKDIQTLNRNLILSHAVGTGSPLETSLVRAAMLIRANTLAVGHSGARPEIVETLLNMLNAGVHPVIPSQGSLGSSGDLAPLSHLALVLSTDSHDLDEESGKAEFKGELLSGKIAMQKSELPRFVLDAKEGLALTNGATFSAAIAALGISLCRSLLDVAEVSTAMTLEALMGASAAFDDRLHKARRQRGQMYVAGRLRALTADSELIDGAGRVQDAYSLRCAPQVHGPARDTLDFATDIIEREVNAATDNPLLFGPNESVSGGNFHGEPVAMAMDYLKIAISEIAAISERRSYHLTDGKMNAGLPPMLVSSDEAAGLNSGLMMPQYTAASLVLENQNLASPDSVHSLPTSGGKEDHNANSMTAARNAWQVFNNTAQVLAIECFSAARALDLRLREQPKARLGKGTAMAHSIIREAVAMVDEDSLWGPDIEKIRALILHGNLDLSSLH